MTTRPWRCGLTLQAVLVAVVACSSIAFGQDSANLRDDTAERLLEALDERGMPDVSLWLLERLAQPDAGISAELRSELAYRKALALVGVGRTEPNAEKRRTTFEQAQQAIDAFLASPVPQPPLPQGADELDQVAAEIAALDRETRRINAHIQQGKLRRERARLLQAEAAKQAKASKLRAFVKVVNYTHVMPTRYTLDVDLKTAVGADATDSPAKRAEARKASKELLEEKFKTGKNRWFFTKLRF